MPHGWFGAVAMRERVVLLLRPPINNETKRLSFEPCRAARNSANWFESFSGAGGSTAGVRGVAANARFDGVSSRAICDEQRDEQEFWSVVRSAALRRTAISNSRPWLV